MTITYQSFFKKYVPEDKLLLILSFFEEREQETALEHILSLLDMHVLIFLSQILEKEDTLEFLGLIRANYADESLIQWLRKRSDDIPLLLPEIIERTLLSLENEYERVE